MYWYPRNQVTDLRVFSRFAPPSILQLFNKMEPYIANKHLTTPQRKHVIDLYAIDGQLVPQIHNNTQIPSPTIRRTIKSGVPRSTKNSTLGRKRKVSV